MIVPVEALVVVPVEAPVVVPVEETVILSTLFGLLAKPKNREAGAPTTNSKFESHRVLSTQRRWLSPGELLAEKVDVPR